MKGLKVVGNPYISLVFNFVYALGNCVIGFLTHSWWFITVGAYYAVLALTRYSVLQVRRKAGGNYDIELFSRRITGILLIRQYNQSTMRFCGNDRHVRFVAQSSKYPGMSSTVRLAAIDGHSPQKSSIAEEGDFLSLQGGRTQKYWSISRTTTQQNGKSLPLRRIVL